MRILSVNIQKNRVKVSDSSKYKQIQHQKCVSNPKFDLISQASFNSGVKMTKIKSFYTKLLTFFKNNAASSQDSDDDDDMWFRMPL